MINRCFLLFMYSIGIAANLLGVCVKTLRRWDEAKKIKCARTPGGHRRFPIQEVWRILEGNALIENVERKTRVRALNALFTGGCRPTSRTSGATYADKSKPRIVLSVKTN